MCVSIYSSPQRRVWKEEKVARHKEKEEVEFQEEEVRSYFDDIYA